MSRLLAHALALCERLAFLPPLLSRLVIGGVFVNAGWSKLQNLERVTQFFAGLGLPFPELQAPFVASVELVCGALVLVGLATRLAALPLIGTMAVALATALAPKLDGLQSALGLAETLYLVLLVQLALGGGGAVALDRWAALAGRGRASDSDSPSDSPRGANLTI